MLGEKIKYYRKKQQMSQETLASKLNVSRQIITKWESGNTLPSVDYLIGLSKLFYVTIDTLVIDDDCNSQEITNNNTNELINFIVQAKQNTYANKSGKVDSSRQESHDYQYKDNDYLYTDSFFGASKFSGQELVYKQSQPIWSMNYYGRVIDDNFSGDFLKKALMQVNDNHPFRGVECYHNGEYTYHNVTQGDIDYFHGKEEIYYQGDKIYEGLYHGGMIE